MGEKGEGVVWCEEGWGRRCGKETWLLFKGAKGNNSFDIGGEGSGGGVEGERGEGEGRSRVNRDEGARGKVWQNQT